jgi:hypothetical protein
LITYTQKLFKLTRHNFKANNINSEATLLKQKLMKYLHPVFIISKQALAVSGRKLATYYACIKYVLNTVLNFGLF